LSDAPAAGKTKGIYAAEKPREAVYERDFVDRACGFRPGRSARQAPEAAGFAGRIKRWRRSASLPVPEDDGLRMRDLVRLAGLPRETIHFTYGLTPPESRSNKRAPPREASPPVTKRTRQKALW
jgi:hypothetical protein